MRSKSAFPEGWEKKYIKDPNACPCCGSENISMEDHDGTGEMWCEILCQNCGAEWTEVYTLTSVEKRSEPDEIEEGK